MKRNLEREAIIFSYWKNGRTIDQISLIVGIPRSSVGHYVRKFNKAGINRGEFKVPKEPGRTIELEKVELALFFHDLIVQEINKKDFLKVKEIIESYFALVKFLMYLSEKVGGDKKSLFVYMDLLNKIGSEVTIRTAQYMQAADIISNHDRDKS